jgi:IS30 family transposase
MSYQHLTPQERFFIELFYLSGLGLREIARRLGRNHGTISRELRRNRRLDHYCSLTAERHAAARRSRPRHYRRQMHAALVDYVEDKLCTNWSPEQIAHRIRIEHPQDARMRISPETVYRWAYTEAGQGGRLYTHLRRRHRRRRQQKRYGRGRRFLVGRVSIAERPEVVANRTRFGDWEADLMVGGIGKGAIMTCLERKSRYLVAGTVENKTALRFNEALDQAVAHVPSELRCTLTLDNGSEMARFKELEKATGFQVYFADPYAAWQRGSNENCNGLLRQYFPKGSNFRRVSETAVMQAVEQLNHRPRKCLGYRTPYEVFMSALSGALAN